VVETGRERDCFAAGNREEDVELTVSRVLGGDETATADDKQGDENDQQRDDDHCGDDAGRTDRHTTSRLLRVCDTPGHSKNWCVLQSTMIQYHSASVTV